MVSAMYVSSELQSGNKACPAWYYISSSSWKHKLKLTNLDVYMYLY